MTATATSSARTPPWRPLALVGCCSFLAVGGTMWILAATGAAPVTGWALGGMAGAFMIFLSIVGWVMAATTRRADPPRLTAATWVTLARGWALVLFVGIVALVPADPGFGWAALGLFLAATTLDAADGALARRTGTETVLGARLDTEVDALVVLAGTVAAVVLGVVPSVFLLVGVARYAFVAGVALRKRRGRAVYDLEPSRYRKVTGAAIMGTIALALLPAVDPAVSRAVGWVVTGPILAHFLWDYLGVSGRRGTSER